MVWYDEFGGSGGTGFSDRNDVSPDEKLKSITVDYDDLFARGVQCEYQSGRKGGKRGGNAHKQDTFVLESNEDITAVSVWHGSLVDAVQFTTSTGRVSQKFGGSGGIKCTSSRVDAQGRTLPLFGLGGRAGLQLDAIGPVWAEPSWAVEPLSANLQIQLFPSKSKEGSTNDPSPNDGPIVETPIVGRAEGNARGSSFNMLDQLGDPAKAKLARLLITVDEDVDRMGRKESHAVITSIKCEYESGRSAASDDRRDWWSFPLRGDEFITELRGCFQPGGLRGLQFVTTHRYSEKYGSTGGPLFVMRPPKEGMCLLGFSGWRNEQGITQLAPIWGRRP